MRSSVSPGRWRSGAVLAALVVGAALGTHSRPAWGVEKAACVAAASEGQVLKRAGKLVAAREQLLVCASTECPDLVSRDCTAWLGEVQRSIPSIVVSARDPDGRIVDDARVFVDGAGSARAVGAPIEVDPGSHTVRVERASFQPGEEHVDVQEGQRGSEIVVALRREEVVAPPPPPPPPKPSAGVPLGTWILGGVGVVALGSFGFFALSGRDEERSLRSSCAPYCTTSQISGARGDYVIANVSLVTGVIALGAAVIVGIVASPSAPKPSPAR